ncbi:MAG: hypothetical protein ACE5KG_03070, partial [Nitrososphaerales archaeon]
MKGLEIEVTSTQNTPFIPVKKLKNLSWGLAGCLPRRGADVIHAHSIPSVLPAALSQGLRVLTIHGVYSSQIELLHGRFPGFFSR